MDSKAVLVCDRCGKVIDPNDVPSGVWFGQYGIECKACVLMDRLNELIQAIEAADNPRDMGLDRDDDAVVRAKAVLNGSAGQ